MATSADPASERVLILSDSLGTLDSLEVHVRRVLASHEEDALVRGVGAAPLEALAAWRALSR